MCFTVERGGVLRAVETPPCDGFWTLSLTYEIDDNFDDNRHDYKEDEDDSDGNDDQDNDDDDSKESHASHVLCLLFLRVRLCVFVCASLFVRLNKFRCHCSLVTFLPTLAAS